MSALSKLGGGHCCVCAGVCYHVGSMRLCDDHKDDATPRSRSRTGATFDEWRAAYDAKVGDLARETLRTGTLTTALAEAQRSRTDDLERARSEGRREGWAEAAQALRAIATEQSPGWLWMEYSESWINKAADYLESIIGGTPEATE